MDQGPANVGSKLLDFTMSSKSKILDFTKGSNWY